MDSNGFDPFPESTAKQTRQLGNRKIEERVLASCLKLSRQTASEIHLDLRTAKGSKMVSCGRNSVDCTEHAAVFFKLFRVRQR